MSIRGIDTQIMVQRTTDFAKDTSTIQRQPETNQEMLANQIKINSVHDQSRVVATTETENEQIRTDVDGGSGGAYSGGEDEEYEAEEELTEEQKKIFLVPPSQHVIDITI